MPIARFEQAYAPAIRNILAASLAALGLLHLIFGERLARMFPVWPEWLPGRPLWAHLAGFAMLAAGVCILARIRPRAAAILIGLIGLASVAALHLPRSLASGGFGDEWSNVLKWLAMATGAFVLATELPGGERQAAGERAVARLAAAAPWALGAFMVAAAYLHVRFAEFVAMLIPEYIPWREFWTYFTAVALAAGGIGLVVPATARLAGLLTSLMIFLWFLLLHTPRMLADPSGPVGWSEMAESLGFAAIAFLLALRAGRGRAQA